MNRYFCSRCGLYFPKKDIKFSTSGESYCLSCSVNQFKSCYVCDAVYLKTEMKGVSRGWNYTARYYCPRCDDDIFECRNCEDFHLVRDARTRDDDIYCIDCYNNLFIICYDCNETYHRDDMYYVDHIDDYLCPDCHSEADGIIHHCDYIPCYIHYGNPKDDLYFGFELEIENISRIQKNNDIAENITNEFLYCKADGSLERGFEIVSHPFAWDYLRNKPELLDNMFGLKKKGYRSYDTDTCGLHIHMTKEAFTHFHLYKFLKFFYEHPDFIFKVSQRASQEKLKEWSKISDDDTTGIIYTSKNKRTKSHDKYVAVNLNHGTTVEIRIFRGTLNPRSFYKNLEFCHSAFYFTKENSQKEIKLDNYFKYLKEDRKEYQRLIQFLQGMGLMQIDNNYQSVNNRSD